jgi:hydrogenase maturation protease
MTGSLTRIIGIGNPLMGDDGIGNAVIELLRGQTLPAVVELIDGGCAGLTLLQLLEGCRRAILIDAADFRAEPGTIRILRDPELSRLPPERPLQGSHQPGLGEVLLWAAKLDRLPQITLVLMQVESCRPGWELSVKVRAALPELLRRIIAETTQG